MIGLLRISPTLASAIWRRKPYDTNSGCITYQEERIKCLARSPATSLRMTNRIWCTFLAILLPLPTTPQRIHYNEIAHNLPPLHNLWYNFLSESHCIVTHDTKMKECIKLAAISTIQSVTWDRVRITTNSDDDVRKLVRIIESGIYASQPPWTICISTIIPPVLRSPLHYRRSCHT